MFSVGIIGLPNVGKSTLFKALTKKQVDISNYPFTTIEPNVGVVAVPDERLDKLAQVFSPPKVTPTVIEFVDVAGLVRGAHKGEGLGNQFLSHIREVDVICQVVRSFQSEKVSHIEGSVSPKRDIETINLEMIAKDLETVERKLEKTGDEAKSGDKKAVEELEQLEKMKKWLNDENLIRDILNFKDFEPLASKELSLLTAKPIIYLYNVADEDLQSEPSLGNLLELDLRLEAEISELSETEIKELGILPSRLDRLIKICYDVLNLITFYTIVGQQELRAWTLKTGGSAFEAAGLIHSDFQQKFIKAEVIEWQELIKAGSWHQAREKGWVGTEGRDYLVKDGDVIEIKT